MSIRDFKQKVIGKIGEKFNIKRREGKHEYFEIWYDGKKQLEIYCSHGSGSKEIVDPILGKIKRQLRLNNTQQLYQLKNCLMEAEEYLKLLKKKNVISN